jgi:hypothetical protein
MALPSERLTGEEYVAVKDLLENFIVMSGLRRIARAEETAKNEAMRAEALGHGRASEIVKLAAESRVWAEFEQVLKTRVERMTPQSR